ncbi:hypothetical protein EB235_17055 [Mesorhizobium loti R88b]|uniref:Uncharacterized protein n=1 Tax=Mesorhizobium loti R88b TaxID=935548 RepID=A0A6M7WGK1_RHILI|nr:hypothetical protein EB235_17055 [Mesorhizobium loti R88b]
MATSPLQLAQRRLNAGDAVSNLQESPVGDRPRAGFGGRRDDAHGWHATHGAAAAASPRPASRHALAGSAGH